MKIHKNYKIPETPLDLTLEQVIKDVSLRNVGASDTARLMTLLNIELTDVATYAEILGIIGRDKKDVFYPISLVDELPKYTKIQKDLSIEGVNFGTQFNIFESCTMEAILHLTALVDALYNASNPITPDTVATAMQNPAPFEDFENDFYLRYLEALPELIGTVVLGSKSKPLDTLTDLAARIADMPAAKLLKIESGFFLSIQTIATRNNPKLAACLGLLATFTPSKNSFGLTKRILVQVRNLVS